jgi:transglutaminase-like putative cysteine protease
MAHWRLSADVARELRFGMTFTCKRKEIGIPDLSSSRELKDREREELGAFLQANRLVLVGGTFAEVADNATKGARSPAEIARAAYDYTIATMRYDKPKEKPGWGRGSTQWACDEKFGNCTDFHAMVMSIGRTRGVPVKFEIGFPLPLRDPSKPETMSGPIPGYHCWAKFYLGGVGWVAVDASEAYKEPSLREYYFGNLTPDRVHFTNGRDVNLVPKQAGEPLNYFIYPYAEADGKPVAVEKSFSFRDL